MKHSNVLISVLVTVEGFPFYNCLHMLQVSMRPFFELHPSTDELHYGRSSCYLQVRGKLT